jgi:hypothetical protein
MKDEGGRIKYEDFIPHPSAFILPMWRDGRNEI